MTHTPPARSARAAKASTPIASLVAGAVPRRPASTQGTWAARVTSSTSAERRDRAISSPAAVTSTSAAPPVGVSEPSQAQRTTANQARRSPASTRRTAGSNHQREAYPASNAHWPRASRSTTYGFQTAATAVTHRAAVETSGSTVARRRCAPHPASNSTPATATRKTTAPSTTVVSAASTASSGTARGSEVPIPMASRVHGARGVKTRSRARP